MKITLPDGAYRLRAEPLAIRKPRTAFNRVAFAAAHVVADARTAADPSGPPALDWDRTLAYRRYLLDLGFGIAEAMDTSQRGMGLDWPRALELITRSLKDAGPRAQRIYSGCGTDQLNPAEARNLDDVVKAYLEQLAAIQKLNGRIILMASRALVRVAKSPDDYVKVYSRVLSEAAHPVILHWLGDMFDPALKGYWGSTDFAPAMETCLAAIAANVKKVDGIKISLLDDGKEITMRRRLPKSVKMYTGDDFNYPALIAGDAQGYSDALLGIFDAIAPAASAGLAALARGDMKKYSELMEPTVPLSRLIFRAPTQYYKTGIVFLAWLNGHQDHFVMVNGAQAMRPLPYFIEVFKLADQARLLSDPELAVKRMKTLLAMYGA
ncbi:MAG: dihydrodipicolinate synthase family protein [Aestuariivirga sp.]|uniref:dihydrodipicolinate synthase family protein n=1 Tax=Aestuariivirga sp. TaxID=2650926 RepID=UPI0038CF3762